MSLKVKFLGALDTITGSSSLLQHEPSGNYYLVDCGMHQGFVGAEGRNRRPFDFDPKLVSAVFLTHAHIDHCGLLPRLVREGFAGTVYCTQATADLAIEALMDSAALMHSGKIEKLYTKGDVRKVQNLFHCPDSENPNFRWGHFYRIEQDLSYGFLRMGHITGSVGVEFRFRTAPDEETTVLFSGDVGPSINDELHGGLLKRRHYPNPSTNFLIVESTYGSRTRAPEAVGFESRIQALAAALRTAFARGPNPVLLFPAFTMQRTQDLLADLHYVFTRVLPINGTMATVVFDSPLARGHTRHIWKELLRVTPAGKRMSLNEQAPIFIGKDREETDHLLNEIFDPSRRERTIHEASGCWQLVYGRDETFSAPGPVLRLSGSGTSLKGLIVKHLATHLPNPQATVILTGYQPPWSPGDSLKRVMALPPEKRDSVTVTLEDERMLGSHVQAVPRVPAGLQRWP